MKTLIIIIIIILIIIKTIISIIVIIIFNVDVELVSFNLLRKPVTRIAG